MPVNGLSPVAMVQRPISMLTHSCRKMPIAAAQSSCAPTTDVIHGHMINSPDPIASPAITTPGPIILSMGFERSGRSACLSGWTGISMSTPLSVVERRSLAAPPKRVLRCRRHG